MEANNPIDQVVQKVRLASLEANNPIDQAIKKAGLAFADLEISDPMDLAMKQVRFAGLETKDPINLTAQELKLAELAVVEGKKTKLTELSTDSKEIKMVLEKELRNPIMPSRDPIIEKMLSTLPEEWQADLKILQERWMKQSYSCKNIRFLTIKHIFHMGLGYIQIQLENIWLPNDASTKEIE